MPTVTMRCHFSRRHVADIDRRDFPGDGSVTSSFVNNAG
jgi:hypothetical protein